MKNATSTYSLTYYVVKPKLENMYEFTTSSKILDDGGNDITIPSDHKLTDEEKEVLKKKYNATLIERGPMAQISSEPGNYPLGTYLYVLRKKSK